MTVTLDPVEVIYSVQKTCKHSDFFGVFTYTPCGGSVPFVMDDLSCSACAAPMRIRLVAPKLSQVRR